MLPTAAPAPRILVASARASASASLWRCARITGRHSKHTSAKPVAPLNLPSPGPAALAESASASAAAARGRLTLRSALPRPRPASSHPPHAHRYRCHAAFSTSASRHAKNQVFSPVRNSDTFQTYLAVSSSSRIPLLTLWTASWCPTCRTVEPLIRSLVQSGVGEEHGGVAFAPIEFDSPDIMSAGADGLAMTYMITAIPTLLSFDAGEAQTTTKITNGRQLADREFLTQWIQNEARRHGGRGGGSSGLSFGGLFGHSK